MTAHVPGLPRSADEQCRLDEALHDLFERKISFNGMLGFRVRSLREPLQVRFDMRPELVGHHAYGRLHGGVTASVLDATAGLALMVAISEKFLDESADQVMHRYLRMGTIDLRIDYLRQGLGRWFDATANVTRLGGRIASVQMALTADDGALVATGAASYVVG